MSKLARKTPTRRLSCGQLLFVVALHLFAFGLAIADAATAASTLTRAATASEWVVIPSPNKQVPGSTVVNYLYGATCTGAIDCWAVGDYEPASASNEGLFLHWPGTSFSFAPSPKTNNFDTYTGIACTAAGDCWAVGYSFTLAGDLTAIERWNKGTWSVVPSPNPLAAVDSVLASVACASQSDCWAVGHSTLDYINFTGRQTLVEHWDGAQWTIVPSPNLSEQDNHLSDVTCLSSSKCWAVGSYSPGGIADAILIVHWDGNAWAVVSPASLNISGRSALEAVTCTAANNCWAVGSTSGITTVTLIEHWDGTAWTTVSSPTPNGTASLYDVTCATASLCWAVGEFSPASGGFQTLIEKWDGTAWTIVSSENTAAAENHLRAVTCPSVAHCFAVGYSGDGTNFATLVEAFAAAPPDPIKAVSRKLHRTGGVHDVDLAAGTECRKGAPNDGDHQVVITFPTAVTVGGVNFVGSGSADTPVVNGTKVTVNLHNVANAQRLTITLTNVSDGSHTADVAVPMRVLLGDVDSDGKVDDADVAAVSSHLAAPLSGSNFRYDVTGNSVITKNDVDLTSSAKGSLLP
jgi:hypothetical protein